jgi:hypothetical protein
VFLNTSSAVSSSSVSSFTKTGGTISGNTAGNDTLGHQVFYGVTYTNGGGRGYYQDTDLGEGDNLSTADLNSGWEGRR